MPFLALLAAYLLGGIPFGYLLVKWKTGGDVRASGSGNIGATNVHRTAGKSAGIATLILDMAKGACAVWLAAVLTHHHIVWMSAAAALVVLGHVFTPFLHFKGGKGVAPFVGAYLFLTPVPLLSVAIIFAGVVAYTHFISLGSLVGAATFPLGVWLILHPPVWVLASAILSSLVVLFRHQENFLRLRSGTERVFSWRSRKR